MVRFNKKDKLEELYSQAFEAYKKRNPSVTSLEILYGDLAERLEVEDATINSWWYASQGTGGPRKATSYWGFIWLLLRGGELSKEWLIQVIESTNLPATKINKEYCLYLFADAIIDEKVIDENELNENLDKIFAEQPIVYQISEQAPTKETEPKSPPLAKAKNTRTVNSVNNRLIRGVLAIALIALIYVVIVNVRSSTKCEIVSLSQQPELNVSQGFSEYTMENGLLSNQVRKIELDEDGLWVGYRPDENTIDGFSRFNRENWTHCGGLLLEENQNINDFLFFEEDVFLATDGRGVASFNRNSEDWRVFNEQSNTGILNNSVYSLTNINGTIWASTYEGVYTFNENYWQLAYRYDADELTSNHVFQVLDDSQGNRWFAYLNKGIGHLDTQGEWHTYYENDEGLQNNRGITLGQSDDVWFATDGGGVISYISGEWSVFTVSDGLPSNNIYDIETDIYGRIWIATPEGVAYTKNRGATWEIHHILSTLDIEFGCSNCVYDEFHAWFVLTDVGLGHVRIPPLNNTIEVVSDLPLVQLQPSESYIFEIEVRVVGEELTQSNGDALRVVSDTDALFGVYPIIGYRGEDLQAGITYTFTNDDNPIIAPDEAGIYQIEWRVWQGRRFVTDPIIIEFEVVSEN